VPVILEEFKKSPRNSFFGEADDAIVCIRMTAAMTISNDSVRVDVRENSQCCAMSF